MREIIAIDARFVLRSVYGVESSRCQSCFKRGFDRLRFDS